MKSLQSEMRQSIIALAGDRSWHDNRKSWLSSAARKAGISYRAARSLFYEEHQNPRSVVVEKVRAATREKETEAKSDSTVHELKSAIAILAARIRKINPELRDPAIDALCALAPPYSQSAD